MLLEFSIIPLGVGTHLSSELARVLAIVDDSGLPYQLTLTGTVAAHRTVSHPGSALLRAETIHEGGEVNSGLHKSWNG